MVFMGSIKDSIYVQILRKLFLVSPEEARKISKYASLIRTVVSNLNIDLYNPFQ